MYEKTWKSLLGSAVLAACASLGSGAEATQTVTVGVTIPVTIPLEVPAGKSFKEAALEFVQRNNIDEGNVAAIESALAKRWGTMQAENAKLETCTAWQMEHNVFPMKNWGTLPEASRIEWLNMDCDSVVAPEPPKTIASLEVNVDKSVLIVRAFEGDTIRSAVERFCTAYGIDFSQNGQLLINAFREKLKQDQQDRPEKPAQRTDNNDDSVPDGTFLFSIPIDVDGKLVRLRVHEGDRIEDLVNNFCRENNVDQSQFGPAIRQVILQTSEEVRQRIVTEMQQRANAAAAAQAAAAASKVEAVQSEKEPLLLLDIPISVDGKDFSMKLYDGDFVDQKISQFCTEHGLSEETHGKVLLQHIAERTQALSQQ